MSTTLANNTPSEEVLRQVAASHNLTDEQYAGIVKVLGRMPTLTEVGIFGVMYSEHCSYCSSRPYLKTFPTSGDRVLVKAGEENAGVIELKDGWCVVFKCESHNHPSAVEPYQGAATGVGGIVRDIFTMGARPVALLNSLRFGPLSDDRTRFLLDGVVRGIAGYGNCLGVPTIGGEVAFDETYRENPLVNVMCIGLMRKEELAKGAAKGVGNPIMYVGSATGRDGLGGASFASRELDEGSEEDRPAVQIGDPFAEKCLIEATLEALKTPDVVGIQDMGAAGLTCSTAETASRGKCGVEIDIQKVPMREPGMTPYEVMLSESQERMLLIVKKGSQERVRQHFKRWGLNAVEIGQVTEGDRLKVFDAESLVADLPVGSITDDAPVYNRPTQKPAYLDAAQKLDKEAIAQPKDLNAVLKELLASPTIASKRAIYRQYDHMVQTNTATLPGESDAAVIRLKGTDGALAATLDGNGRYCYLDPYEGGKLAVAEAARNVVCTGARPLAVTDCLNFGSPLDPEIMWQFKECVRGMAEACEAFNTPVTGGNVSLYNEGPNAAIDPTPVVGMVGYMEEPQPLNSGFINEGDTIVLLSVDAAQLGAGEYLAKHHGLRQGKPPRVDFEKQKALHRCVLNAHAQQWLNSAHDVAEGGLAVCLAECSFNAAGLGAVIEKLPQASRKDEALFGEAAGQIVVTCSQENAQRVLQEAKTNEVEALILGIVQGDRLVIGKDVDEPVSALFEIWSQSISF